MIREAIVKSLGVRRGMVVYGANIRALSGGITTDKIFDFVKEIRYDIKTPMVFMTYANVVFSYGAERFIRTCREYGIDLISLIAPTSENRIAMIAKEALKGL